MQCCFSFRVLILVSGHLLTPVPSRIRASLGYPSIWETSQNGEVFGRNEMTTCKVKPKGNKIVGRPLIQDVRAI